jgi:phosphoglycerate dehydrogenase-like enzyme
MDKLRVGLTRDLLNRNGEPSFGRAALDVLDRCAGLEWEWIPEPLTEITPDIAACYDAIHLNGPRVTSASIARGDCRLKIVARHGVGYDSVDVAACTARGILVTNAPLGVRRPVAVMTLTFVLALSQKLMFKQRLARENRWRERQENLGDGLVGRTLGVIGGGSIGKEILRLAQPFNFNLLVADAYVDPLEIELAGARVVPLEQLMGESDYVVVACLLNDETRHIVNAANLALMKATAYLINVARGPIVDEAALIAVLQAGKIAGAGLDVFEQEPPAPDNPLLSMENVIVTPHSLCWTDQCFAGLGGSAIQSIVELAERRVPKYVVDRRALDHPAMQGWFGGS